MLFEKVKSEFVYPLADIGNIGVALLRGGCPQKDQHGHWQRKLTDSVEP